MAISKWIGKDVDVAGYLYTVWSSAEKPGCFHAFRLNTAGNQVWAIVSLRKVKGVARWVIVAQSVPSALDPHTHARASDPVTSHAAAEAASYKAGSHKARLLDAYHQSATPLTDREAAVIAGLEETGYWKRCSDLRNDKMIAPVKASDGTLEVRYYKGVPQMVCDITADGMKAVGSMKEFDEAPDDSDARYGNDGERLDDPNPDIGCPFHDHDGFSNDCTCPQPDPAKAREFFGVDSADDRPFG